MIPTNELRFVEREIDKQVGSGGRWYTDKHTARILQQKFVAKEFFADRTYTASEEWRDVPVVREEK